MNKKKLQKLNNELIDVMNARAWIHEQKWLIETLIEVIEAILEPNSN